MNIEEQILAQLNNYRAKRGDIMFDDDSSSDDDEYGGDTDNEDMNDFDETTEDDDVNMDTSNDGQIWTAGNFLFCCYYIGQGDCTFIVCPDGKTILLDCGSIAYMPDDFQSNLHANMNQYCKNKKIDAVILTHTDRDHYNKMDIALEGFSVDNMYISTGGVDSPLVNYFLSSLSDEIYNSKIKVNFISDVYLNSLNANYLIKWKGPEFKKKEATRNNLSNTQEHRILSGPNTANPDWYVSIIASNVGNSNRTKGDSADAINTRSVVTKFWKRGTNGQADKIAILHGDATNTTTNFIKTTTAFPSYRFLNLVSIPHHGSEDDNCNEPDYINSIKPNRVVVSACSRYTSFFHPRSSVITLYEQYTDNHDYSVSEHPVDCWFLIENFSKGGENKLHNLLYNWTTNSAITVIDLGNGYYERNPIQQNQPYIICPSKGMVLYRLYTTMPILSTFDLDGVTPFEYFTM